MVESVEVKRQGLKAASDVVAEAEAMCERSSVWTKAPGRECGDDRRSSHCLSARSSDWASELK
jgi:hypothetical protein